MSAGRFNAPLLLLCSARSPTAAERGSVGDLAQRALKTGKEVMSQHNVNSIEDGAFAKPQGFLDCTCLLIVF